MIIDLEKFIEQERPYWEEMEVVINRLEGQVGLRLDLARIKRIHYLYQRVSEDLMKICILLSMQKIYNFIFCP